MKITPKICSNKVFHENDSKDFFMKINLKISSKKFFMKNYSKDFFQQKNFMKITLKTISHIFFLGTSLRGPASDPALLPAPLPPY